MSAARALTALVLCSGCTNHVSIGAVETMDGDAGMNLDASRPLDATMRDAERALDAVAMADTRDAADADAWVPDAALSLRMRLFGRDDLVSLTGGCNGRCIEAQAIAEGGRPPYRVQWWDARTEPRRSYCPSEGGTTPFLTPAVSVTDASGQIAEVPLTVFFTSDSCAAGAPVTPWQACVAPPQPGTPNCAGPQPTGLWFLLKQPLERTVGYLWASWTGTILLPTRMIVGVRESACAEPTILSDRTVGLFDVPLELPMPARVESVWVQFPDQPGGYPPPGVNVTVGGLCFEAQ